MTSLPKPTKLDRLIDPTIDIVESNPLTQLPLCEADRLYIAAMRRRNLHINRIAISTTLVSLVIGFVSPFEPVITFFAIFLMIFLPWTTLDFQEAHPIEPPRTPFGNLFGQRHGEKVYRLTVKDLYLSGFRFPSIHLLPLYVQNLVTYRLGPSGDLRNALALLSALSLVYLSASTTMPVLHIALFSALTYCLIWCAFLIFAAIKGISNSEDIRVYWIRTLPEKRADRLLAISQLRIALLALVVASILLAPCIVLSRDIFRFFADHYYADDHLPISVSSDYLLGRYALITLMFSLVWLVLRRINVLRLRSALALSHEKSPLIETYLFDNENTSR